MPKTHKTKASGQPEFPDAAPRCRREHIEPDPAGLLRVAESMGAAPHFRWSARLGCGSAAPAAGRKRRTNPAE
jgi:hypothetical protein